MNIDPFVGPVAVTLVYVAHYYAIQGQIMRVKLRLQAEYAERGERFDRYFGQDREMLAADRHQLNTLEHMPPFLVLLWLNAVFVGTTSTTIAGSIYVAARIAYPFALGFRVGRGARAYVFLATGPGYAVLTWFAGALVYAMLA